MIHRKARTQKEIRRLMTRSPFALMVIMGAFLLAGCDLDTRAIPPWTRAEVSPSLVCPGDIVTVDWEMGVEARGCLSSSDAGLLECRGFATITSSPNVFVPPSPSDDHTGIERVAVSSATTFTFNGRQDGLDWPTEVRTVDVLAEFDVTTMSVLFEGVCAGSGPAWTPVDVTSDSSEFVQVEGVCNPNSFPVRVNSTTLGRSVLLDPGGCTSELDGKPGPLVAFPAGISPLVTEADCSPTREVPPLGFELDVGLRCSTTGTISMEVVAGTPDETDDELATFVTETPEPTPTMAPITVNFNADSYAIFAGECTRLRWDVQHAEQVLLEGEAVPALEAEQVCPKVTTNYTLVASNSAEEVERYVIIEVAEPVIAPEAPAQLNISNQVCTAQSYAVTLSWIDVADNEDGYRVYRDGALIATLGANAKGYTDNPPYGGPYVYGVEAYNSAGASSRPTVQEPGCIY